MHCRRFVRGHVAADHMAFQACLDLPVDLVRSGVAQYHGLYLSISDRPENSGPRVVCQPV
jgi:hypothetical protein